MIQKNLKKLRLKLIIQQGWLARNMLKHCTLTNKNQKLYSTTVNTAFLVRTSSTCFNKLQAKRVINMIFTESTMISTAARDLEITILLLFLYFTSKTELRSISKTPFLQKNYSKISLKWLTTLRHLIKVLSTKQYKIVKIVNLIFQSLYHRKQKLQQVVIQQLLIKIIKKVRKSSDKFI